MKKTEWFPLVGLIVAVMVCLYFLWDQHHRPVCEDVSAAPWMQRSQYDPSMGQCDER